MPNNDAIPMNVVEVLASAELNVNDNSESVAMSVVEGGAGSSGKADKVSGATAGDLAGLDATGNLTDSGKKPADFVAAENFYATQLPMSSTDPTTVAEKATDLLSQIDGKASIIRDSVSNVPIATVPDGAAVPLSALKIAIEPVQDLHGQANPYPAGGGKNLIDADTVWADFLQSDGTFYHPLGTTQWHIPSSLVGIELTFSAYAKADANNANLRVCANIGGVNNNGTLINNTTSFALTQLTFTPTSTDDYILLTNSGINGVYKEIQLEKGSSATAYAPYSNICPISGWTGANVQRTGKNLMSNAQSASLGNNWQYFKTSGLRLKANTYTISIVAETAPSFFYVRPFGQTSEEIAHSNSKNVTFTLAEEQSVWFDAYWVGGTGKPSSAPNIQLEVGSTASAYTPFVGQTYPITWQTEAGTVYGGTLDPVNGVLTATYGIAELDDLSWTLNSQTANHFWQSGSLGNDIEKPSATTNIIETKSDILSAVASNDVYNNLKQGIGVHTNGTIRLWYQGMPEDSTSFLDNHVIIYPLATPITYQLDPVQIETLTGTNNLWADCGNILLMEYGCDTKGYIDKKLAELTALILENT